MIAIFAFTKPAVKLGLKLKKKYNDSDLFVSERNSKIDVECIPIEGTFNDLLSKKWDKYDCFIMIMATGIVVRSISNLIKHKSIDPGVLVVDQKGEFVIPLLSGHLGGANELAIDIAEKINGKAVITTASDVQGIPAIDDIARKNNCNIEKLPMIKDIASFIIENEDVALYTSVKLDVDFPENVHLIEPFSKDKMFNYKGTICITEQIINDIRYENIPNVWLRPKNIIVGIGCKKGKSKADILNAIQNNFKENNISMESIKCIATVEIKKDEEGIVKTTEELGVPFKWYTINDIKKIEDKFRQSKFVKQTIGVGAVCEPSAYLAAEQPLLISNKTSYEGITIALVKDLGVTIKE